MMEVYAGCLAYTDHNIGRVIQAVEETGELDNTLIIYLMGDNGASAEGTLQGLSNEVGVAANGVVETLDYLKSIQDDLGGELYYNHYPVGWAHAMDTPFQWTKQVASHFGGTANDLVISWPKGIGIKQVGEVRSQFSHVIDIVPTILEATRVPAPTMINGVTQKPIEGTSLVYTFDDAKAATRHTTQYFEMQGNRAIYRRRLDGQHHADAHALGIPGTPAVAPDEFPWELYHVAEDFSQAKNARRRKLRQAQATSRHLRSGSDEVQRLSSRHPVRRARRRVPSSEPHRRTQHIHLLSGRSGTGPHSRRCNPGREEQGLHHYCGHWDSRREKHGRCARHAGRTVRRLGIAPSSCGSPV